MGLISRVSSRTYRCVSSSLLWFQSLTKLKIYTSMVEARIVYYLIAAYIFSLAKDAHTKITDQLIQAGHRVSHASQNKFLTVIGMKVNFYYMLAAILVTLITRRNSSVRKFFSWFWASIVFPVACVVCGMYWGLVAVNPDLVGQ